MITPQVCIKSCVAGCFCEHGYVRSEQDGECISWNECQIMVSLPDQPEGIDDTSQKDGMMHSFYCVEL